MASSTTIHTDTYTYQPLPSRTSHIRTLTIHPAKDGEDLRCSLQVIDLPTEKDRRYEALSYCWGDPNKTRPILLDNVTVSIRLNLFLALTKFRETYQSRTLWVDALCINQLDLEERESQVALMIDVYRYSYRTLAWIGNGEYQAIHKCLRPISESTITLEYAKQPNILSRTLGLRDAVPVYNDLENWCQLLRLEYFSRVWIFQELIMSQFVVLYYGESWVPLNHLEDCLPVFERHAGVNAEDDFYFERARRIVRGRAAVRNGDLQDIVEILSSFRGAAASDPRDNLYAVGKLANTEASLRDLIVPNYSKTYSVESCYTDATKAMLDRLGNLDLLSAAGLACRSVRRLKIPSWVPDWSFEGGFHSIRYPNSKTPFSSTLNTRCSYEINAIDGTLRLRGYVFDAPQVIGCASPAFHTYSPRQKTRYNLTQFTEAMMKRMQAMDEWRKLFKKGKDESLSIFADTLTAGMLDMTDLSKPEYRHVRLAMKGSRLQPKGVFSTPDTIDMYMRYLGRNAASDYKRNRPTTSPKLECFTAMHGRRMFSTKDGRLGLGPSLLHFGDVIAFLEGGRVPYVLRPVRTNVFKLIGECYVNGVMRGEMFDADKCHVLQLE